MSWRELYYNPKFNKKLHRKWSVISRKSCIKKRAFPKWLYKDRFMITITWRDEVFFKKLAEKDKKGKK